MFLMNGSLLYSKAASTTQVTITVPISPDHGWAALAEGFDFDSLHFGVHRPLGWPNSLM